MKRVYGGRLMVYGLWLIVLGLLLAGCGDAPHDVKQANTMPAIYPDYRGVTIPVDIAPLNFNSADEEAEKMDVVVTGSKGGRLHSNGDQADFDVDDWHALTRQNRGGRLTFTVCVMKNGRWTQYKDFTVEVSADALDDYGLTYRRITPGYEVGGDIGIYQRDIHTFRETAILTERILPGRCFNCHTPNRTDPSLFTLQIRGEGGGTLVQRDGRQTWYDTKTDSTKAAGSYASWHPDGRYCAYSANAVHQAFFVGTGQRIEVYHDFSTVEILDTKTNQLILSPLIQNGDLAIHPAFSADGRTLYYSTSKPCRVPAEYEKVKCSLCAIPFDAEKGVFGEQVDTLLNGPATDKSYTLVRPSYDGRFLLYTVSSRSNFPIAQDDADLWLMDLKTGGQRELKELNSPRTESYHNWSSNSRWIVFSSKREDGMYTRLYLAHVGTDGQASKPFLLPQRYPRKYYREMMDAYNVPDFTRVKVALDAREAYRQVFYGERVGVRVRFDK